MLLGGYRRLPEFSHGQPPALLYVAPPEEVIPFGNTVAVPLTVKGAMMLFSHRS